MCEAVRSSILEGDIDTAVKLIESVNGSILQVRGCCSGLGRCSAASHFLWL